jgi:hypothetical protein
VPQKDHTMIDLGQFGELRDVALYANVAGSTALAEACMIAAWSCSRARR